MNKSALNNLVAWIVATLPDSLSQREQLLTDILRVLPAKHPMRERISTMLTYLESHQNQQLEFPGIFPVVPGKDGAPLNGNPS